MEWLNISRTAGTHSAYVSDRSQLVSLNTSKTDYLLGKKLFINRIISQIFWFLIKAKNVKSFHNDFSTFSKTDLSVCQNSE